jgi:hypothetical protein
MNPAALPVAGADLERVVALIEELSRHGLGVFRPHRHASSGAIAALPAGVVAVEHDLRVSFARADAVPAGAVPVGWRWNGAGVEVCAACCTPDDEAPPF